METVVIEEKTTPKFDWYNLLTAIIMILLGAAVLIWPSESSEIIAYVVSGLIAAAGLVLTILYFTRKERAPLFSIGSLSVGLTLLSVGILLLLIPHILITILPVVLGCFLIFSGFNSLQTALELIRLKLKKWYVPLIFAVVAIACGVLALLNPFSAASVLMVFLGIALVVEGVLLLVSLFMFRKSLQ